MNQTKVSHYLNKFRFARTIETLDKQADLADERHPADHQAINEAYIIRWRELKERETVER